MFNSSPHCIICGAKITYRDRKVSWKRNFRAIRCDGNSQLDGKPFVTGVGSYVPPEILYNCAAPSSAEQRWDDNFVWTEEDSFPPLIGDTLHPQPGFLFHESCWELLRGMLHPHAVPIQRLYDICLSCPAHTEGWLDWGHNYGGLMDQRPVGGYPWEDVYIAGYIRRFLWDKSSPLTLATSDPLDVLEVQQALVGSQDRRENTTMTSLISSVSITTADCFQKLPQEILEQIQMLLPSRSVADVRLASRSFAALPLTQSFWASRFACHQERGYCFEARDSLYSGAHALRCRNWRAFFEDTAVTPDSSNELKNRKRIWCYLKNIADLVLDQPLVSEGMTRELELWPKEPVPAWRPVGGDFSVRSNGDSPYQMKCRVIYEQIISIASSIRSIGVSFRELSDKKYVSGLRLVLTNNEELRLGYVLPCKEKHVELKSECFDLNGFIAAVSPRGVMALRVVTGQGEISNWVGLSEGLPQTVRLCTKTAIHALKCSFDGFKMVSLAVPTELQPLFPDDTRGEHLPLRTTGLWYPGIPPSSYHLHDDVFTGRNIPLLDYRPLVHVMFGGRRGNLLKYLTRISVTVSNAAIVGIDFFYTDDSPVKRLQACPSTDSRDDSVKIPFLIDGPGGERLTSLQSDGDFLRASAGYGSYRIKITSLKVNQTHHCNYQRMCGLQIQLPTVNWDITYKQPMNISLNDSQSR
ncbi:hypothetical protein ANOM_010560 [Aspergillus nomiae NRRL 13137]|uniref:F-box domain-containing protein n=1 Tax=Aspergillus nomiae NRRL (strain ATCC 15546 / NRRL 13137 / CBS 260.88 / M93) TaxID=1509407 RepID=A0A0L1IVM7_ASPN3|nr:uncharacterized protein ANOM_010560 [Aspergillus nomiae NRRL 13137]KNG83542.1 hypothetical protein ANOM_010560 [Aspergillus nomiae NRRL 13137]